MVLIRQYFWQLFTKISDYRCIHANNVSTLFFKFPHLPVVVTRRVSALAIAALLVAGLAAAPGQARSAPVSVVPAVHNLAWFLVAFELGPWEEYLIQELTPELEQLSDRRLPTISRFGVDEALILPDFAVGLLQRDQRPPVLRLARQYIGLDVSGPARLDGNRFERSLLLPGISAPFGSASAVTVSAVLASQEFVAAGMNLQESEDKTLPGSRQPGWGQADRSQGAGLRFALSGELLQGLTLEAAFQSRIEMSELASLRGVHGSRAELDIPARIQLGMQWQAGTRSHLNLGMAQIFYSEVGAFPSRALPARFNALLGDSTSPQFGWNDLLVYSVGWSWRPLQGLEFNLDYLSRSQPQPSSPLLASALSPELAQEAFLFGVHKTVSPRSRLLLNAAYAPPEFAFGGNVLGVVSDRLDQTLEVQAVWNLQF